jgi:hypothetical protein
MTENMKECLAQTKAAVGDMVTVVKTEVCSPLRDLVRPLCGTGWGKDGG